MDTDDDMGIEIPMPSRKRKSQSDDEMGSQSPSSGRPNKISKAEEKKAEEREKYRAAKGYEHPYSKVKYNKKDKCFELGGVNLTGVCNILKEHVFPRYEYEKAVIQPANRPGERPNNFTPMSSSASADIMLPTGGVVKKAKNAESRTGKGRGILLDKQITETIRLFRKYALKQSVFFRDEDRKEAYTQMNAKDAEALQKICAVAITETKQFWQLCYMMEWKPIASQVPIAHAKMRVGTGVDVVFLDKDDFVNLLEIKCGFEGYYHKHTATKMNAPFVTTDSAYNQHQLQALLTHHIYKKQLKDEWKKMGKSIGSIYVLRIHKSGIDLLPIEPMFHDGLEQLVRRIKLANNRDNTSASSSALTTSMEDGNELMDFGKRPKHSFKHKGHRELELA